MISHQPTYPSETKIACSIGVIVHEPAPQIASLLATLLDQHLHNVEIAEVIVVASACSDDTLATIAKYTGQSPLIRLIEQSSWARRANAINVYLAATTAAICVVVHKDALPHAQAVENLVRMFDDPTLGMVGAQKVVSGTPEYLVGFVSHLRGRLEHSLCLDIPRLNELIAFRKVFDAIPIDVAMDEAFVEALMVQRGLSLRYAPDALVYTAGPTSISAFIEQRRHNHVAYLHLKNKYGYTVSSLQSGPVAKVVFKELWGAVRLLWVLMLLAILECWSRVLGWYDFAVKRNRHVVWDMAWSQKQDVQRARQTRIQDRPKH